ncbi:MAG: response regulator transcription factor [Turicibacter sp.]
MFKVLVIEDNYKISQNICEYLAKEFEVTAVYDGFEGSLLLATEDFDLVILDLMLPNLDGMTILKKMRETNQNTGIIMLTAKEDIGEKLRAFEYGANDYLTKPFFLEELKARLYVMLKNRGKISTKSTIVFKDLTLHIEKRQCFINFEGVKHEIVFQDKIYQMLEYLISNKNQILLKEQIFERICGVDSDATLQIIEVYLSKLRKQLAPFGYDKYIKTKRGVGYLFDDKEIS